MSTLKDGRLKVITDDTVENCFTCETSELTFARINKIADKWCVWFYTLHLQRDFVKIREALMNINAEFIKFFRGQN